MLLNELRVFNAIAQTGSFVAASEQLSRTQQTLSTQLSSLEARYGVELIVRGRGKTLGRSPLGEQLWQITRHLFTLEQDAHDVLLNAKTLSTGQIRVGAIAPNVSIRIMRAFAEQFPNIDIALSFGNSEEILHKVQTGLCDVGILGGHETQANCMRVLVVKPEIVLIANVERAQKYKGKINRADFLKETLLLRESGSETRDLLLADMKIHAYEPHKIVEIGSRDGVIAAAAEGLGFAGVAITELRKEASLQILRFADFRTYGALYAICLKERAKTRLISEFLTLAQAPPKKKTSCQRQIQASTI